MRKWIVTLCLLLVVSAVQATPMLYDLSIEVENSLGIHIGTANMSFIGEDLNGDGNIAGVTDDVTGTSETTDYMASWHVSDTTPTHLIPPVLSESFDINIVFASVNIWFDSIGSIERVLVGGADGFPGEINKNTIAFSRNDVGLPTENGRLTIRRDPDQINLIDAHYSMRFTVIQQPVGVPEPSTVWLLLPGLLGLAFTKYIRHPES